MSKCVISSLLFNDDAMTQNLGSFALFRDEEQKWGEVKTILENKGFKFLPISNDNSIDYEIREDSNLNKVELYEAIKRTLLDFVEENNLAAFEDIYKVGIGNQMIFTIQSK